MDDTSINLESEAPFFLSLSFHFHSDTNLKHSQPELSCHCPPRILHSPSAVKTQTIVNTPGQSTFSSTPGPCPHYITFSTLQFLFYHSTLFPAFLYAESFLRALPPEVSQNPFLMFTVNRDNLSPTNTFFPH